MLIKSENSNKKENSQSCIVWEYDFPNKDLGFAVAKINGKYPESGKIINTKCNAIYFIKSGKGVIHNSEGDFRVKEGDAFFIEKNKWYWVEGEKLVIVLPTSPAWDPEQYKIEK